jgi:hypothetical protein
MRPGSARGSSRARQGESGGTILDDIEKEALRLAEETPAVMTAAAEALDGGAQHVHSVALLPH